MAEENKNQLFRQKSINTIQSPESLDQYLKVTSPGVWALLAGVVVILIGVVLWGIFGRIQTKATAVVISDGESVTCLIPEKAANSVVQNPVITMDGKEYSLQLGAMEPAVIESSTDVQVRLAGEFNVGDVVYSASITEPIEAGIYTGTILTESLSPAYFLFN